MLTCDTLNVEVTVLVDTDPYWSRLSVVQFRQTSADEILHHLLSKYYINLDLLHRHHLLDSS